MSSSEKFRIYVRAYGQHFFRTALWVTLVCLALFGLLLLVPQAGELILSQAAGPAAEKVTGIEFACRLLALNAAAAILAASVWLSARILVHTGGSAPHTGAVATGGGEAPAEQQTLHDHAARQAAIYVPRQLGLSVFLILQLAAAGSISMQGYWLPVALMLLWLFILMMGLLRIDHVAGQDLLGWWKGLLVLVFLVGGIAFWKDLGWIASRLTPLPSADPDALNGEAWLQAQRDAVNLMGGFVLAACAVLFFSARWITNGGNSIKTQAWVSGITGLLILGVFSMAKLQSSDDAYWIFFALQSALAVGYWLALLHGHLLLGRAKVLVNKFRPTRKLKELTRAHVWLFTAGCIVSVTLVLALWAYLAPQHMGGYLGAVGIVLMFFAYIVLVVSLAQAWVGRSSWRMAVPAGSVGVLVLVFFFAWPTAPQPAPAQARSDAHVPITVRAHLEGLPREGPLFAIAAHGGGIRAALYTAAFVAWLDHETDNQFSARLLAASGASGGSVGLAVWAAAHKAGCKDVQTNLKGSIPPCVNAVNETLAQDHLAPLMASGLFRDYPMFLAKPARGNSLQDSIRRAAGEIDDIGEAMVQALDGGLHAAPFPLLLNTTVVGTASPLSLVTREGMLPTGLREPGEHATHVQSNSDRRISLLTAAMHSARFPLISPKSLVAGDGLAVVDGGYFDNSGVAVLRQHLLSIQSGQDGGLPFFSDRLMVISLDSEPVGSTEPAGSGDSHNSFDEIIGTIVAARGAHGHAAWQQLCNDLDKKLLISTRPGAPLWNECEWPSELSRRAGQAPLWQQQREARAPALGWYLSKRSAYMVTKDAREKATEIARRLNLPKPAAVSPEKGVTMQRMAPG